LPDGVGANRATLACSEIMFAFHTIPHTADEFGDLVWELIKSFEIK